MTFPKGSIDDYKHPSCSVRDPKLPVADVLLSQPFLGAPSLGHPWRRSPGCPKSSPLPKPDKSKRQQQKTATNNYHISAPQSCPTLCDPMD